MNETLRQTVIEILQRGEELPIEWARELFPPEKREYELVYHGKEREEDILAETMAVPLQPVSTFNKNGDDWHNMLIFGDNLQVLKTLSEKKKTGELCNEDGTPGARLIYIDPPFAARREFKGSQDQKAYQDKVYGARYIEFIRKRLIFLKELLSDDGTIYVHLDWKKTHYLKVILDEVFGERRFRNDISWHYYNRLPSGGNVFESKHDSILVYTKSGNWVFHPQYEKRAEPTKKKKQAKIGGKSVNARDEDGNIIYLELENRKVDDVWRIPLLVRTSAEYTGYPTQKTETLLERIIGASSNKGDLVIDAFAGAGTSCATAEKLGRRWIGIDCGKLSIYSIQKRMLNLKTAIGNKSGKPLKAKAFTLYNAGLYDFSTLRQLEWKDWRFFALQLFSCRDEPHTISGLKLDGKLKGSSVLVFNFHDNPGRRIDRETVEQIHTAVKGKVGRKFFIIAPRGVFDFQEDYIDLDGTRFYAMRIPYSIINELHSREFTALEQPKDEKAVNETVDSVGFDFIQPPKVDWFVGIESQEGALLPEAFLEVKAFQSKARLRSEDIYGGLETLSMIMLDFNFDGEIFDLDAVFYGEELKTNNWKTFFPVELIGEKVMIVFLDIHGNESRVVVPKEEFKILDQKRESTIASTK